MVNKEIIYKKIFIKFLKEHKSYRSYFQNVKESRGDAIQLLNDLISRGQTKELIMVGFDWSSTQEGPNYWSKLHRKWCEIVSNIQTLI